jgi:hypothetical protein
MKTFALVLTALVLTAAGCGGDDAASGPPSGDATYSGVVIQVDGATVLVRADGDACGIWTSQADSVHVFRPSGSGYTAASWDDLEPGMTVDLWIPGPIAESCPMQGAAEAVVIVDAAPA